MQRQVALSCSLSNLYNLQNIQFSLHVEENLFGIPNNFIFQWLKIQCTNQDRTSSISEEKGYWCLSAQKKEQEKVVQNQILWSKFLVLVNFNKLLSKMYSLLFKCAVLTTHKMHYATLLTANFTDSNKGRTASSIKHSSPKQNLSFAVCTSPLSPLLCSVCKVY